MYTQMFVVKFDGFDRIKYITCCAKNKKMYMRAAVLIYLVFIYLSLFRSFIYE